MPRPTYVDGSVEIALSEQIALLSHPHVDIPFSLVVLRNLTLDGKLCLRDEKNPAKTLRFAHA